MIHRDVAETVGRTPLVELRRVAQGLPGRILAKLEMRNPCGSVKDRVGVALIEQAERQGILKPGATLVEATGGNTGIGLAFAAAIRGYRLILTMPETMSTERVALLRHFGAEVELTPGILMRDALARAEELVKQIPIDEVFAVGDDEAFECARRLARGEGMLAGVSSGAALHAALAVACREDALGRTVVVLLADTGERYMSTRLFTHGG